MALKKGKKKSRAGPTRETGPLGTAGQAVLLASGLAVGAFCVAIAAWGPQILPALAASPDDTLLFKPMSP